MSDLQSVISTSDFVDLFVSNSFADVKGLAGASDSRVPVPDSWKADVAMILEQCRTAQRDSGGPEFSIEHCKVVYRVTHLDSSEPGGTYVLRRSKAQIRQFRAIGIPTYFVEALLARDAVGLALICGGFGVGKTTTGASWVVARHLQNGGISLAIEDPKETAIDGVHGSGRCIGINASRHKGGYKEHLIRGLRSGVDFIFLGEIRDSETAYEALKAGSNGELILATFHAGSIPQALERLIALAEAHTTSAAKLLANSLLGVMWQNLEIEKTHAGTDFKRIEISTLLVAGENAAGVREKIRRQEIGAITQDIDQQAAQAVWGTNKP
ncbi:ATPase, T2SS/T4P/T4SS family [Pseudomonas chlororaphis]|uniref:ATPase, T2SS/T4P/T4SS family n=1 Tax=Pseudomonas chlororaphis TaxID=587753 RepID=UPI002D7925A9|nr:ATPase, T2SS/T4P/T4SS family [Pseudomonas chlororaphis]